MTVSVHINEVIFSDGTCLNFSPDDFVVFVGPNNSGKSAVLRSLHGKIINHHNHSHVVKDLHFTRVGSSEDLINFFRTKFLSRSDPKIAHFYGNGARFDQLPVLWANPSLNPLDSAFVNFIEADGRTSLSNSVPVHSPLDSTPTSPSHFIYEDSVLEEKLNDVFRRVFKMDIVLNRLAGPNLHYHVGQRPIPGNTIHDDRLSMAYQKLVRDLPLLHQQGDGMRSFAGLILHTIISPKNINLIDEPESFLHPPQARALGQVLVGGLPTNSQFFIATHSQDFLTGVLDVAATRLRVIRIVRESNINKITELNNDQIRELWSDPLMRYSNILSGIFHENVVLCESDGDCRFYQAVGDAILQPDDSIPDRIFVQCSGKHRMPVVTKALRNVGVPVTSIVDIDVLNEEKLISQFVISAGGDWENLKADWIILKSNIDALRPPLSVNDVKREMSAMLAELKGTTVDSSDVEEMKEILKRTSPWSDIKRGGESMIPGGDVIKAYNRLKGNLKELGIIIVPVGELERFCPSVPSKNKAFWLNEVLSKNLQTDPELQSAREFCKQNLPK